MNMRVRLIALVVIGALIGTLAPALTVQAQSAFTPGAVVALQGTPHLWIADEQGVLHWAGDTRALAGKHVVWSNRTEVTLVQLLDLNRGDPWLSAGLLKDGDPIYLVKWETDWAQPKLLHIQSIVDVELFGINGSNYGNFVLDRATWEQRFGIPTAGLQRSTLPAATGQIDRYSGSNWGLTINWRYEVSETTITERGLRLHVFEPDWQVWEYLSLITGDIVFRATGVQTEGDGGGIGLIIEQEVGGGQGRLEFGLDLTWQLAYLERYEPEVDDVHILTGRSDLTNLPQRGQPFTLEVRVQGQQVSASLNGTVLLEAHDPLYMPDMPGLVALAVTADAASGPVAVEWQSAEVHHLSR